MKFKDFTYEKLDMDAVKKEFSGYINAFKTASTFEAQDETIVKINALRIHCESMFNIVLFRHAIDTTNAFYENENNETNKIRPHYEALVSQYYAELIRTPFRKELEARWGKQIFRIAELKKKTVSEEVIEYLQKENQLITGYQILKAGAAIPFEGEIRNLEQLVQFTTTPNRTVRKMAQQAISNFYLKKETEFDALFHELVQVRHAMAKKLGYKNFVEMGYDRMLRTDYTPEAVAIYRKQILESVVPLMNALEDRQAKRLKLNSLKFYDEPNRFITGNAVLRGDSDFIIQQGLKMYRELSPETAEFFDFMTSNELFDLIPMKGKSGGNYCDFIAKYKSPFIFANFSGTFDDINILTHEGGHGFQVYSSRHYELPEYYWPTFDASEIHSFGMEFFAWPWLPLFFHEEAEKYKYIHMITALSGIIKCATGDEFQHWVYENPEATPRERKSAWRTIEKKYSPMRDYDGDAFLERGGLWFRYMHFFLDPFYYIDYALAQICAFEFWNKANMNKENAWEDYMRLCKAGGSKSFLELLEIAHLSNPFEDLTLKRVVKPVSDWLNHIDDENL